MDQAEFQRKLEEKVAEMVAPADESSPPKTSAETPFLASNILGQYVAREEAGQTNCDSDSKVCSIYFVQRLCR